MPITQHERANPLFRGQHHQPILLPHAADMVQQAADDSSSQQHTEQPKLVSWH